VSYSRPENSPSLLVQAVQKPFVICVMLCVLGYLSIAWLGGGWSRLWSTAPSTPHSLNGIPFDATTMNDTFTRSCLPEQCRHVSNILCVWSVWLSLFSALQRICWVKVPAAMAVSQVTGRRKGTALSAHGRCWMTNASCRYILVKLKAYASCWEGLIPSSLLLLWMCICSTCKHLTTVCPTLGPAA